MLLLFSLLINEFKPLTFLNDQLEDVNLVPGEKSTATVGYEVSSSQKGFHLLYDYNEQHMDIDLGF